MSGTSRQERWVESVGGVDSFHKVVPNGRLHLKNDHNDLYIDFICGKPEDLIESNGVLSHPTGSCRVWSNLHANTR